MLLNMKRFELNTDNMEDFLPLIRRTLKSNLVDKDSELMIHSTMFIFKTVFDAVKKNMKTSFGSLCQVKSAPARRFCGYKMYGLQVKVMTEDMPNLENAIDSMFKQINNH